MDTMEMDALRRAQEMQRGVKNPQRSPQIPKDNKTKDEAPKLEVTSSAQSPPFDPLNIFEDKEKLLILLLILVLSSGESEDPTLILALLYIII